MAWYSISSRNTSFATEPIDLVGEKTAVNAYENTATGIRSLKSEEITQKLQEMPEPLSRRPPLPEPQPGDGQKFPASGFGPDRQPREIIRPGGRTRCGGVALALGGGIARGWSHIGVLRAADEFGLPISMISGTSIGALVGGSYLAGKLDDLEEFARTLTKANILRFLDFSLRGSGLINGSRLARRMEDHMDGINIEDLDKPFVAVATEIQSGHEVWLSDGPIVPAIRASYALPGIFTPITHGGRQLVDGALVNPVPVSVCRAYEPNLVIAVNVNAETFGRATVVRHSHYEHVENGMGQEDQVQGDRGSLSCTTVR